MPACSCDGTRRDNTSRERSKPYNRYKHMLDQPFSESLLFPRRPLKRAAQRRELSSVGGNAT